MKIQKWLDNNTESLKGKTVAITGSTGGLGRSIASFVASLGGNLILLDRNEKRSTEHAKELFEKFNVFVKTINVDMVDISSVKAMCGKLSQEKVDVLILNAGAYNLPRAKASTGFDQTFQINFLSPYYIVRKMLDVLERNNSKVVVVGSIAHKGAKIKGNDVDFSSVKSKTRVYGNAKRFLMFSLFELLKNNQRVKLAIAHPGITATNITTNYSKFVQMIVKYPMRIVFTSPKKASLNVLKGIFEDCPYKTWIGPRIFDIWGKPKLKPLKTCLKEESAKIFEISEELFKKIDKSI